MFAAMKSEVRKLLTVRSTYVIVGVALLIVIFFAFYATGLKVAQAALADPKTLAGQAQQAIASTGLLGSLVAVLLVTHEYRYNTIMYTLSASNSRTKTFFAKFFVATLFALFFSLLVGVLSPALTSLAIHIKGFDMVPQKLDFVSLLWTVLFTGWGYTALAFVFAMVIRLQVGAISALFLFPAMVESLLGLLMKAKASYLPFNSLQAVVSQGNSSLVHVSPGKAAAIFTAYAAVGLFVSWVLFLRRDAV